MSINSFFTPVAQSTPTPQAGTIVNLPGIKSGNLDRLAKDLQHLGLDIEIVAAEAGSRCVGAAIAEVESLGAGEIVLNSVDRDGTQSGYDLKLLQQVSSTVSVPVVACGGASGLDDFVAAVEQGGASAVAAGSLFVFVGPHRAVLINYPDRAELARRLP